MRDQDAPFHISAGGLGIGSDGRIGRSVDLWV